MATFTISITEELKKRIEEHPEINWAEYLKQRLEIVLKQLKRVQELRIKGEI
ncbi:MAG: hypothetical protein AABW46_03445 [Nanoarchaeota archaeon]